MSSDDYQLGESERLLEDLLEARRVIESGEGPVFGVPPMPASFREAHDEAVEVRQVRELAERMGEPVSWEQARREVAAAKGGRLAAFSRELLEDAEPSPDE